MAILITDEQPKQAEAKECFCRIREADINDPLTLKALDEFTVWICGFGLEEDERSKHWELSKAIKKATEVSNEQKH